MESKDMGSFYLLHYQTFIEDVFYGRRHRNMYVEICCKRGQEIPRLITPN